MKPDNNNNINILEYGTWAASKKINEKITLLIRDHNPDIICVRETNLKNDNLTNLANYDGYNKNRLDYSRHIICQNKLPKQSIKYIYKYWSDSDNN